jgi:hypothetical protein
MDDPAELGQLHLAAIAVKQPAPEFIFQELDRARQRGLRDVAALRSLGKAEMFAYRQKVSDLVNLHNLFLSRVSQTALAIATVRDHGLASRQEKNSVTPKSSYVGGNAMSNESGAQLTELRDLAFHNVEQLSRATTGWIELARKTLDAAEANTAALYDHARKLSQAESPAECMKLQTEFLKSSVASMQRQSADLINSGKNVATVRRA